MRRIIDGLLNELTYLHNDHLGSPVLTTNSSGEQLSVKNYLAYGKPRTSIGTTPTDYGFTGQKGDPTGLVYMGARYYDPQLGTFISADTIVPDGGLVVDYNRYAYARLNPLKYVDPSGHDPVEILKAQKQALYELIKKIAAQLPKSQYSCTAPCEHTFNNNIDSVYHAVVQIDALVRYPGSKIDEPISSSTKTCCIDILLPTDQFYEVKSGAQLNNSDPVAAKQRAHTTGQVGDILATGLMPAPAQPGYYIDISSWVDGTALHVYSNGEPGMLYYREVNRKNIPEGVPVVVPSLVVKKDEEYSPSPSSIPVNQRAVGVAIAAEAALTAVRNSGGGGLIGPQATR